MKPIVHWLEAAFWGQVDFIYLDQYDDANDGVFNRYNLSGRPIFLLLDTSGNEVERWYGYVEQADLHAALTNFIESTS